MSPTLIFDLDGTLVDTAPDLLAALNIVLVGEGRRAVDRTDLGHLVGHGARAMLVEAMTMTGEPAAPERLPALIDAFIAHYRDHIADESRPYPGVEATLARLAKSARLGVLTNKPQELAVPLLERLGLASWFRAIHGAGRFSYVKPDARVFHAVVDEVGGNGSGALMIGDSATDVATARAAAVPVPVILLSYGYTPTPARALAADLVIDRFSDLPEAIAIVLESAN